MTFFFKTAKNNSAKHLSFIYGLSVLRKVILTEIKRIRKNGKRGAIKKKYVQLRHKTSK